MNRTARWGVVGMALLVVSGCRTAAQRTTVSRVDLNVEGGNRGYLIGTPPPAKALKTTREMLQVDIELPNRYQPTVTHHPVDLGVLTPAQGSTGEVPATGADTK